MELRRSVGGDLRPLIKLTPRGKMRKFSVVYTGSPKKASPKKNNKFSILRTEEGSKDLPVPKKNLGLFVNFQDGRTYGVKNFLNENKNFKGNLYKYKIPPEDYRKNILNKNGINKNLFKDNEIEEVFNTKVENVKLPSINNKKSNFNNTIKNKKSNSNNTINFVESRDFIYKNNDLNSEDLTFSRL
jgi:hypothetical protein